ncbi:MAG: hypothetical protein MUO21_08365 [Nitrososphaeraceae archaeon]|nr:hypothetical protein [Nitrososphaeraceae archaeon]
MKRENLVLPSLVIIFFLFLFGFFSIESIYAHNEIKVGNYTIVAGWEEEPPLVNILNNIVVYVFENESPVRNVMKDLSVNINYGGVNKELNFVPSEETSGLYLAEIIPSKLGSYSLNLKGNINTQNIDNDIEIEDVEDATKITFPIIDGGSGNMDNIGKQITPIINDLTDQIDELKNEMNSTKELIQNLKDGETSLKSQIEKTNLLSYIAIVLSAFAIILVAFRRKITKTE